MAAEPGGVFYPSNSGTPVAGQPQTLALDAAGNLKVNVQVGGGGGSSTVTLAAGTSNAGTFADSTLSAGMVAEAGAAAAANALQIGGVYSSTARTLTTGQGAAAGLTAGGFLQTSDQNLVQYNSVAGTVGVGALLMGISTTGTVAATSGNYYPLSLNANSALRVAIGSGGSFSAFSTPSAAAASAYAPVVLGAYNSAPYALISGQTAPVALNQAAALYVDTEGLKNTYAFSTSFTPAAAPTDVLTIAWVSKTAKLRRLRVRTLATTAGNLTLTLVKRSSANTGGTSAAVTLTAMNSGNAASTAVITQYSANPTGLGTAVGSPLDTAFIDFGLTASGPVYDVAWGTENDQPPTLLSSGQVLAINFGGGAVPTGGQITISGIITEE